MSNNLTEKKEYIHDKLYEYKDKLSTLKDDKFYKEIYNITNFFTRLYIKPNKFPRDIREDITQNVVVQIFEKIISKNPSILDIKKYISKCVVTELSKINRNKYLGQKYIISMCSEAIDSINVNEYWNCSISKSQEDSLITLIDLEQKCVNIRDHIIKKLNERIFPVRYKSLFLYILLLAVSRKNPKPFNKFPLRIRILLRDIYFGIQDSTEYLKN